MAAHRGGIGGCRIKPAQPPGRQHGSAGPDEDRLHIAVAQPAAKDADDAPLGMGEIGYVGLPRHYGNGGYETSPSRELADRTVGETMIAGALELLK